MSREDNGKKPVAEISAGSVSIPIYPCPVKIKTGKKAAANGEPESDHRKTYPSFQIVYYEGTRRVFRRRSTLEKAKALAKEVAGQLASDGIRAQYFTEQDRRIYALAQKSVKPLNLEVDQACRHYAELQARVKGATVEEAIDF